MGRSGADYIPDEIRDQATALGYSGVNTYTEALGLNERRLYKFFQQTHKRLRPYYNLANFCGCTLDELLLIIEAGKLTEYIERIKNERGIDSIMAFERMAEVGPGFIRSLLRGKISATSFNNWNEVAVSLDWTLHKLAKTALKQ